MTTREILEERWNCATRDVQRFQGEAGISAVNSKRWTTIDRKLEEMAALLVEEVNDYRADPMADTEATELGVLTEAIWREIERRMLEWAEGILARREERREGVTA